MNKIIYALLIFIVSCNGSSKENSSQRKSTSITIENQTKHFSPIIRGTLLKNIFKFQNTGNSTLYIEDVIPSCGCVVVDFPSHPIAPNKTGYISIEYDSKKNVGFVELFLDIYANFDSGIKKTITFDTHVVSNPEYTRDYEQLYNSKIFE